MVRPAPDARMTYAEYVAAEGFGDVRREFLKGEVFSMTGEAQPTAHSPSPWAVSFV
jgi:hypothetical protein